MVQVAAAGKALPSCSFLPLFSNINIQHCTVISVFSWPGLWGGKCGQAAGVSHII